MTITHYLTLDTLRTIQPATLQEVAECCGLVSYEAWRALSSLSNDSLAEIVDEKWVLTSKGQRQWTTYMKQITTQPPKKSTKPRKPFKASGSRATSFVGR